VLRPQPQAAHVSYSNARPCRWDFSTGIFAG
jgi:hypothetical protein